MVCDQPCAQMQMRILEHVIIVADRFFQTRARQRDGRVQR